MGVLLRKLNRYCRPRESLVLVVIALLVAAAVVYVKTQQDAAAAKGLSKREHHGIVLRGKKLGLKAKHLSKKIRHGKKKANALKYAKKKKKQTVIKNALGPPPLEKNALELPKRVVTMQRCPFCFGTSICNNVMKRTSTSTSLLRTNDQHVQIRQASANEEKAALTALCGPVSQCDPSQIASKLSRSLSRIWKLTDKLMHHHSFRSESCMTPPLWDVLTKSYGAKAPSVLFAFSTQPEPVILKFLERHLPSIPAPRHLGSCVSRYAVTHPGTPLPSWLKGQGVRKNWALRANLSAQLLSLVDAAMNGHARWAVALHDLELNNLAVSLTGSVRRPVLRLVSVQSAVLLDKKLAKPNHRLIKSACNKNCLQRYRNELTLASSSKRATRCARAATLAEDAMYHAVCTTLSRGVTDQSHPRSGLLQGGPPAVLRVLAPLLKQCVTERRPGERRAVAAKLQNLLSTVRGR